MESQSPSLEEMMFEYDVIEGAITLGKNRIHKRKKLPDDMHAVLNVLTRAYISTAKKCFPREMKNKINQLEVELAELNSLYQQQKTYALVLDKN